MTDIHKALAFATECLKWDDAFAVSLKSGVFRPDARTGERLFPLDSRSLALHLETFLGKRFHIQINRGTSSLFQWSAVVGLQNRASGPPLLFDHGHGESDDMLDAIFDACVAAARLYPINEPSVP